jgi:RNA polymerase sigma-70 factor (ECF subfamily)
VPQDPASDQADLRALKGGDDSGLDRLIGRWEKPLLAFAWRFLRSGEEAQDLVAEVFVRVYQQRARLREDTRLSAWLFTTLANLCRNRHRWRRRHPTVSLEARASAEAEPASGGLSPAEVAARDEEVERLAAAVDRLPHDLKTALLLHHYEALSLREIGAICGCSERGVETRLYRARRKLREDLTGLLNPQT